MTLRTTSLTLSAVILVGTMACAIKTSDEDRFREPIPESSDVALGVPGSTGGSGTTTQTAGAGGIRFADLGGTNGSTQAKYYRFTRDVTDGVDLVTGYILGAVVFVAHTPPTKLEAHRAVWGPGQGNALDPVVWRFTVTEVADKEYDYVLDGRPKASQSEADYRAVLKGHGWGIAHALHRTGTFTVDHDAFRALDSARGHDSGTAKVDFDLRKLPATIEVALRPTATSETVDIAVTHETKGAGALAINATVDLSAAKDTKLETVTLHSKWLDTGAGRADATMSNGDLPSTVDATECWSTTFARVYYLDSINYEPSQGAATSCAIAP